MIQNPHDVRRKATSTVDPHSVEPWNDACWIFEALEQRSELSEGELCLELLANLVAFLRTGSNLDEQFVHSVVVQKVWCDTKNPVMQNSSSREFVENPQLVMTRVSARLRFHSPNGVSVMVESIPLMV